MSVIEREREREAKVELKGLGAEGYKSRSQLSDIILLLCAILMLNLIRAC